MNRRERIKLKSLKGLTLFTFRSIFYTYKSQTTESKENTQVFFIVSEKTF